LAQVASIRLAPTALLHKLADFRVADLMGGLQITNDDHGVSPDKVSA
jgi:hypothetical protein